MLGSAGKRVAEQGQLQFLAERRERLDIPDGCRQRITRARRSHRKRAVAEGGSIDGRMVTCQRWHHHLNTLWHTDHVEVTDWGRLFQTVGTALQKTGLVKFRFVQTHHWSVSWTLIGHWLMVNDNTNQTGSQRPNMSNVNRPSVAMSSK